MVVIIAAWGLVVELQNLDGIVTKLQNHLKLTFGEQSHQEFETIDDL